MTVVAWVGRRQFPGLPEPEARLFRVAADTQVLAHCYWQADRAARPALVALHGLEGSSRVHYMRGLASKAWRRGWNVVLLNQRNCGGTEALTPSLYHSGLTADPRAVIEQVAAVDGIRRFGIIGYSLGGNLTMKLAGELAGTSPPLVRAVAAICPTIDLDRCVRAIERPRNIAYQFNFVRNLKARMRRKAALWPGAFDLAPLGRVWTIRKFDDVYTAPSHGFGDAATYYERASALRVIDRIRIPSLILTSADDPFVPVAQFDEPAVRDNPHVRVLVTPHGGHCAYIGAADDQGDRYWAERAAIDFLSSVM
ncbi:MAG: alpha/beta fold hydrolase [Acidobacteria bacterium]|nr:alpha/beta fold hydrolase [Acidobacteriota bacterium]